MNPVSWVDIIGFIVLPVLGYGLMKINGLQDDLNAHKLNVATNFVSKDDHNKALDKIDSSLEKIFDKLDTLAERRTQERKEDAS